VCTGGKCQTAGCADGVTNGNETDVDCGGSCTKCTASKLCSVATDCQSGVCSGSPKRCQAPTCTDGIKNQTETDVDCGGVCAPAYRCASGQICSVDADCATNACTGGVCSAPCSGCLKAQFATENTVSSDGMIRPIISLVNSGSSSVQLSEITLRYWFSADGLPSNPPASGPFATSCYFVEAPMSCGNVVVTFNQVSPAKTGADWYAEFSFTGSPTTLAAGASVAKMKIFWNKSDWSAFNVSNDYSFGSHTTLMDWTKITVYQNGVLVYGTPPP
jgi:hypothetical protein